MVRIPGLGVGVLPAKERHPNEEGRLPPVTGTLPASGKAAGRSAGTAWQSPGITQGRPCRESQHPDQ